MRWWMSFLVSLMLLPAFAAGEAMAPGETRSVEGTVSAVDVAHRAVVLEVTTPKGDLTVGVTLEEGAVPKARRVEIPLSEVGIGEKARLKYTRQDGRLVGLELELKR